MSGFREGTITSKENYLHLSRKETGSGKPWGKNNDLILWEPGFFILFIIILYFFNIYYFFFF